MLPVESVAVLTPRTAVRARLPILRLDVVPFRAGRVVVIDLLITLTGRVPSSGLSHVTVLFALAMASVLPFVAAPGEVPAAVLMAEGQSFGTLPPNTTGASC
jgi:hypothetical protein